MNSLACYQRATQLRKLAGSSHDLLQLAADIGIHVLFDAGYKNLLGMYCSLLKGRFIFLNDRLDETWLPMVLAHEIGHDQLHRSLARYGLQEFELFRMNSRTEYEANAFAAHLLLDSDEVYDALREGLDIASVAQSMNCNINLVLIKLNEMHRLGYDIRLTDTADSAFFKKIRS
ncbi:MAG: ImmA/IrrE family metallo-endopeptidase [Selenomonas bovis]